MSSWLPLRVFFLLARDALVEPEFLGACLHDFQAYRIFERTSSAICFGIISFNGINQVGSTPWKRLPILPGSAKIPG